nr:Chain P, Envelope glycoprotein [Human immunodeficiency virus 1]3GHB_Q Chain Q, Envelope glycoprotein [Human immunodeficiency virus 1]
KGVRIGPGQA